MKTRKYVIGVITLAAILIIIGLIGAMFTGCDAPTNGSKADIKNTKEAAANLQTNQPTPTDIEYSLERYNLIRRAYWVNGQREKANALPCEIEKPMGLLYLGS